MLSTKDFEGNVQNSTKIHSKLMEYVVGYNRLCHASPLCWLGNLEYLEAKSHLSMVFSFTTTEDRAKFIAYGPIWVFNQQCTITQYEDCCRQDNNLPHESFVESSSRARMCYHNCPKSHLYSIM